MFLGLDLISTGTPSLGFKVIFLSGLKAIAFLNCSLSLETNEKVIGLLLLFRNGMVKVTSQPTGTVPKLAIA